MIKVNYKIDGELDGVVYLNPYHVVSMEFDKTEGLHCVHTSNDRVYFLNNTDAEKILKGLK